MGTLYVVATPIGNLEDISQRALRVLNEVSLVAAEDTRRTRKLLAHYNIGTTILSFHEHNKHERMNQLLTTLETNDVALVSDAGTPAISDPGKDLVEAAWSAGHVVSPIPGPSAPAAALAASGMAGDQYLFLGYLPRKSQDRRKLLTDRGRDPWTLVAFEVPHRVLDSMKDMEKVLGEERRVVIGRELTKVHEEVIRGPLAEVRRKVSEVDPRGEYTIVIEGAQESPRWDEEAVRAAIQERVAHGDRPSDLARELAQLSGWPRRRIYKMSLEDE